MKLLFFDCLLPHALHFNYTFQIPFHNLHKYFNKMGKRLQNKFCCQSKVKPRQASKHTIIINFEFPEK